MCGSNNNLQIKNNYIKVRKVRILYMIKEEENIDELKEITELNPDILEDALGDTIIMEEDEEEIYFSVSTDDDLDIAFIDDDTRDWI